MVPSSLPFDDLNPPGALWDAEDVGVVLLDSSGSRPCTVCARPTGWVDLDFESFVCSPACAALLWAGYVDADRQATMRHGPAMVGEETLV